MKNEFEIITNDEDSLVAMAPIGKVIETAREGLKILDPIAPELEELASAETTEQKVLDKLSEMAVELSKQAPPVDSYSVSQRGFHRDALVVMDKLVTAVKEVPVPVNAGILMDSAEVSYEEWCDTAELEWLNLDASVIAAVPGTYKCEYTRAPGVEYIDTPEFLRNGKPFSFSDWNGTLVTLVVGDVVSLRVTINSSVPGPVDNSGPSMRLIVLKV